MKYPFRFKVQIFDSDERTYYISNGLGLCSSYANAANQIEDHFGTDLCAILFLELYAEEELIFLTEDTCDDYSASEFPEIDYAYKCNAKGEQI